MGHVACDMFDLISAKERGHGRACVGVGRVLRVPE